MSWRKLLIAIAALLCFTERAAADSLQPKLLRWSEDYSRLRVQPRPFPLSLKYIPLTDDGAIYLTLGGEARARVDAYDRPSFGLGPARAFASVQSRLLVHGDLHVGPDTRVFLQLGAFDERGRKPGERAFDEGALDVQLLFADVGSPHSAQIRLGRQEVTLPGGRNAAVRDAANIRRAFDGVKLGVARETYALDAFIAAPVELDEDAFGDRPHSNERFWGVYITTFDSVIGDASVDAFYLGRRRARASFAEGIAEEERHMLGVRFAKGHGAHDLDVQAGVQFGRFGVGNIGAWHVAADAGYMIADDLSPRLGLRVEIASGDRNNGDGDLGTYDPLYPNGAYVTDAALLLPGNSLDIQPTIGLSPVKSVRLTAGIDLFWRIDGDDGTYQAAGVPLVAAGGSSGFVSAQPFVRAVWRPSPYVEVIGAISHATAGGVIDSAGGRALSYGLLQIAVRL